uniref:Uncharacterized protein n=1 Tax=Desertifilum tharense IPPAS B-1220 TaxID=1781255 RepID=A0ACD5H031_9CYAN
MLTQTAPPETDESEPPVPTAPTQAAPPPSAPVRQPTGPLQGLSQRTRDLRERLGGTQSAPSTAESEGSPTSPGSPGRVASNQGAPPRPARPGSQPIQPPATGRGNLGLSPTAPSGSPSRDSGLNCPRIARSNRRSTKSGSASASDCPSSRPGSGDWLGVRSGFDSGTLSAIA